MLFFSIKYLPLGLVSTIQNLQPFLTLLLAFLILREAVKRLEIINMIISFAGVLIIVLGSSKMNGIKEVKYSEVMFFLSISVCTLSTFFIALNNVLIRSLKSVHWALTAGFQAFTGLIFATVMWVVYKLLIEIDGSLEYNLSWSDVLFLFLTGSFGAVGQMLWIKSL